MRRIIFSSLALLLPIMLISACGDKKENSSSDTNAQVDSITIELVAEDSTTVFDLTIANGMVEYDKMGPAYLVASIRGIDQTNSYFWIYAVNDTLGMVASNLRKIGPGDKVIWYFRKIIP